MWLKYNLQEGITIILVVFACLQSNNFKKYEIKTKMIERASLWHFKVYNATWVQILGNTLYIWPQYGENKQNSVY